MRVLETHFVHDIAETGRQHGDEAESGWPSVHHGRAQPHKIDECMVVIPQCRSCVFIQVPSAYDVLYARLSSLTWTRTLSGKPLQCHAV